MAVYSSGRMCGRVERSRLNVLLSPPQSKTSPVAAAVLTGLTLA